LRSLLFWLAFPFLVPQALWLRRTAPRFAGAAGPNQGSVGAGEPRTLVAIGDSIIAGVGASEFSKALVGQAALALSESLNCEIRWLAHGYIGANTSKLLNIHMPELPDFQADIIIASVGVNDITSVTSLPRWRRNLRMLLRQLTASSNKGIIAFAGLPPLGAFPLLPQPLRAALGFRAVDFDREARRIVAEFPQVVYVPIDFETSPEMFAADGYHPSESSYVIFGESVSRKIVERLVDC